MTVFNTFLTRSLPTRNKQETQSVNSGTVTTLCWYFNRVLLRINKEYTHPTDPTEMTRGHRYSIDPQCSTRFEPSLSAETEFNEKPTQTETHDLTQDQTKTQVRHRDPTSRHRQILFRKLSLLFSCSFTFVHSWEFRFRVIPVWWWRRDKVTGPFRCDSSGYSHQSFYIRRKGSGTVLTPTFYDTFLHSLHRLCSQVI